MVLYPSGGEIDMGYYRTKHLPLVRNLLDPMGLKELVHWSPQAMDPASPYQLVAELRFQTAEAGLAALEAHGPETQADIPNFTTVVPTILIGTAA